MTAHSVLLNSRANPIPDQYEPQHAGTWPREDRVVFFNLASGHRENPEVKPECPLGARAPARLEEVRDVLGVEV